jgi:hypothetical protein
VHTPVSLSSEWHSIIRLFSRFVLLIWIFAFYMQLQLGIHVTSIEELESSVLHLWSQALLLAAPCLFWILLPTALLRLLIDFFYRVVSLVRNRLEHNSAFIRKHGRWLLCFPASLYLHPHWMLFIPKVYITQHL